MKNFRNNGAIGALLDEYERAVNELVETIEGISTNELIAIADPQTSDPDCTSIQSILRHVLRAGLCYVIEIRRSLGENIDFAKVDLLDSVEEYISELRNMFAYNEQFFEDYPNIEIEEHDGAKKIKVRWGQVYDIEQLFEHAIVHILRHRRQIKRFIIKLRKDTARGK